MLRMNNSFLLRVALKWAPDGKRKRGQWRKTEWRLVTALGYRHSWWRLTDCLGEVKSVAPLSIRRRGTDDNECNNHS